MTKTAGRVVRTDSKSLQLRRRRLRPKLPMSAVAQTKQTQLQQPGQHRVQVQQKQQQQQQQQCKAQGPRKTAGPPALSLSAHYLSGEEESYVPEGCLALDGEAFARRYEVGEVVGKGRTSVVRIVRSHATGTHYACKVIDKSRVANPARLREEINILRAVAHENIVMLHDMAETPQELLLVIDLARGGDLYDRLMQKRFSEPEARRVLRSLLLALDHLHSRGIIHRDVKPENILLTAQGCDADVKLTDLGLAKVCGAAEGPEPLDSPLGAMDSPSRARAQTSCGTDQYVAPEILKGEEYGCAVDMWAAGIVLYILLAGSHPFAEDGDVQTLYTRVLTGSLAFPAPAWDAISPEAQGLVRGLLAGDPEQRLTCMQALQHPWLQK